MHFEMALSHALGGATFGGTVFAMRALDPYGTDTDTGLYLWLIGAACLGAGIAGALCTPTYGHPRLPGWIGAALGFTLATYTAGLIGGNLFVPLFGGFAAVPFLYNFAAEEPLRLLPWAALGVAIHLRATALRRKDTA